MAIQEIKDFVSNNIYTLKSGKIGKTGEGGNYLNNKSKINIKIKKYYKKQQKILDKIKNLIYNRNTN